MILTINGIHESAEHTTDRIGDRLQREYGLAWRKLWYPTRSALQTRNRRHQYMDARNMLAQMPSKRCDLVAHSWGCLLACRMMELGGTDVFGRVWFFAPAIDSDWVFPLEAFQRLHVVYHAKDRAVWAAKALFWSWHPWGDMGRVGYRGIEDARIANMEDRTPRPNLFHRMHGHYFEHRHVDRWAQAVACDVDDRL